MTKISLFCLGDLSGGIRSFNSHLMRLLEKYFVCDVSIYKISKRSENKERFSGEVLPYRNVSIEDALLIANRTLAIITYFADYRKSENAVFCERLMENGVPLVIHDERGAQGVSIRDNVIVSEAGGQRLFPNAPLLLYPYVMDGSWTALPRTKIAVCMTRVDFEKHTELICEANNLLPEGFLIDICGKKDGRFVYFKLARKYPHWDRFYLGSLEEVGMTSLEVNSMYYYSVDMSTLPNSGGRAQYSFLEAMEAGATVVLLKSWLNYPGIMANGYNCIGVSGAIDLVETIMRPSPDFQIGNSETLAMHDSELLADMWIEVMLNGCSN